MIKPVMDIFRNLVLAGVMLLGIAATPTDAAPTTETLFGEYLAGRHAQETRDYATAAEFFEDALKQDPGSPELISRTFLMEASEGRFDRARALAERELKLDPTDAVVELILLINRFKASDTAGALTRTETLP